MAKYEDLSGRKFGLLLVIERDMKINSKKTYYLCKCDCGVEKSIRADNLKSGKVVSCGCYHKNVASKKSTNKKYNDYEIFEDEVHIKTSKGAVIKIDLDDFDKVKDYCWSESSTGYAQARALNSGNSIVLMHRLIVDVDSHEVVDHENHDKLDNRKSNLRVCLQHQNMANRKMNKPNNSGQKGVYWNDEKQKWHVQIGYKNKNINLGYFKDIEEAVKVRKEAESKYFGEFRFKEEV